MILFVGLGGKPHLLQISLVYINTLMIQQIFSEPQWKEQLQPEDLRALTPLVYTHVTPYGQFRLDMNKRIVIESEFKQEN